MAEILADVVIRQSDVKGVELRNEGFRNITVTALRIVIPAEVPLPVRIPGALVVRRRIILRRQLTDPEYGGDDIPFPSRSVAEGR